MKTLLKDLPEHKERIENSYLLKETIKDCLTDITISTAFDNSFENQVAFRFGETLRRYAEFEIEDSKVRISNVEDVVQYLFKDLTTELEDEVVEIEGKGNIAEKIKDSLTDFVNENYEWKGIKA